MDVGKTLSAEIVSDGKLPSYPMNSQEKMYHVPLKVKANWLLKWALTDLLMKSIIAKDC